MSQYNKYITTSGIPSITQQLKSYLIEQSEAFNTLVQRVGIKDRICQDMLTSFASQLVMGFYADPRSNVYWVGFPHTIVRGRYRPLYRLLRLHLNRDCAATFQFLINNICSGSRLC